MEGLAGFGGLSALSARLPPLASRQPTRGQPLGLREGGQGEGDHALVRAAVRLHHLRHPRQVPRVPLAQREHRDVLVLQVERCLQATQLVRSGGRRSSRNDARVAAVGGRKLTRALGVSPRRRTLKYLLSSCFALFFKRNSFLCLQENPHKTAQRHFLQRLSYCAVGPLSQKKVETHLPR